MNVSHEKPDDRATLLEAIILSSDDAIITKDLNGIITSWNPAATRIFDHLPEEMIGQSILRLIPEDLHQEEHEIIRKLRNGERIAHYETTRLKKNGTPFEVSLTISPIKDASGTIVGASKILRDISDRKRLEASLLQAEKIAATGRMAATIAHEINNPLEGLLNLIYLAKLSASDPSLVVQYLTAAEGELGRIAHIAKQTLGYYHEHTSPLRISLSDLVRDVLAIYEPRLKHNNIQLRTSFPPLQPIVIKRGEMIQVISNLIVNALHAMPSGGILSICLSPTTHTGSDGDRQGIALDIEDTGIGIPAENLKKIFEPFFTTRDGIGTGIGLWVTRQFIEAHGGAITVHSSVDPASHGTKMSIFLPYQNSRQTAAS
jgi:PAS domain S-box-containing protein